MTDKENPISMMEEYLTKANIPHMAEGYTLSIAFISECPFFIIVDDYFIYVRTQYLLPKPIPLTEEFSLLYFKILQANNLSKFGKYYLNDENNLDFGVDFRIQELSEDLFYNILNLIRYVVIEKFPPIIAPFKDTLT
jgi:hypothetical protein